MSVSQVSSTAALRPLILPQVEDPVRVGRNGSSGSHLQQRQQVSLPHFVLRGKFISLRPHDIISSPREVISTNCRAGTMSSEDHR